MDVPVIDIVLIRFILPVVGVILFVWGAADNGGGRVVVGALAVATSIYYWKLPSEVPPTDETHDPWRR